MSARRKKAAKKNSAGFIVISALFCICILCVVVFSIVGLEHKVQPADAGTQQATVTEQQAPEPVGRATIGSAGDVLIHVPIFNAAYSSGTGEYDFSDIFTYSSSVIEDCDYFVANLETTLAGTEGGRKYTGYPRFNTPDAITDALKHAGVDCLLTANNHCYDTSAHGVERTQQVVKEKGFDYTGTRLNGTDSKYLVKDVNGIKFGMICYTYETQSQKSASKALNGILVDSETAPLINSFDYDALDDFYADLDTQMDSMRNEGAQVIVVYLHWGEEYQLTQNSFQQEIAQRLCDMGVDVIVGGHPHVVQPVELLTASNSSHRTVCVYSLGNIVSNQRRSYMGLKTGHTEDGLIFEMTFSKYSDDSIRFESVKAIPTWVHLYTRNGKTTYNIVPLEKGFENNAAALGLDRSSNGLALAKGSYERTNKLVAEGIAEVNSYLKKRDGKVF